MDFKEFISDIKGVKRSRKHYFSNSYCVKDFYRWLVKHNITTNLDECNAIIRGVNKEIVNTLLNGKSVSLPQHMGTLEVRKFNTYFKLEDDKLEIIRPINWQKTLAFWYEDDEARNNKTLIREDTKEVFTLKYNKSYANYKNYFYTELKFSRELKQALKEKVNNNEIDSFLL